MDGAVLRPILRFSASTDICPGPIEAPLKLGRIMSTKNRLLTRLSALIARPKPSNLTVEVAGKTKRIIKYDVIIAGFSFFVSTLALYTTYEGQRLDRFYREVSIRPRIVATFTDDNNGLSLRNDGTGPAVINLIKILGTTGRTVPYKNVPQFRENMSDVVFEKVIFQRDVAESLHGTFGTIGQFNPYLSVKFPNWGVSSILPGNQRDLYKLDKSAMISQIDNMLQEIPLSSVLTTKDKIDDVMPEIFSRYGLLICYCSITNEYCVEKKYGSFDTSKYENICPAKGEEYKTGIEKLFNIFVSKPIPEPEDKTVNQPPSSENSTKTMTIPDE